MMFLLYLAQVIKNIPGVQEQRQMLYKHCRHHHFRATIPQNQWRGCCWCNDISSKCYTNFLHLQMQWVLWKGYMNLLHLSWFEHAMTPIKGLHDILLHRHLSSVTYFCFEDKLVWKLTPSPPLFSPSKHIIIIFMTALKGNFIWLATSLVFLKLNDIVLYYRKKIFLDTKKFYYLWVGHFPGMATNPYPPL